MTIQVDELHGKLHVQWPRLLNKDGAIFHRENIPHISRITAQLNELQYELLPHLVHQTTRQLTTLF